MSIFDDLFPPEIRVEYGDPRVHWPAVLPAEEAALHRAVACRQREFRAGRTLARQAMHALSLVLAEIPAAADRAPVWPATMAGSISHCADLCVVAIGRAADGFVAIGVDLEPAEDLDADLTAAICGPEEHHFLAGLPPHERGLFARLIFSAKECAYKCQYPLSQRLLDFSVLTISIDRAAGRFTARFNSSVEPFNAGDELAGRYAINATHILTGMALTHAQLPAARPRHNHGSFFAHG
ncbi:4'-phosphopantetheinyl transferase family protein [Devosia sp. A449]